MKTGIRTANVVMILLLLLVAFRIELPEMVYAFAEHTNADLAGLSLYLLVGVFVAPTLEELFYRGVLYAPVARRLGKWKSILALSLVQTLVHMPAYMLGSLSLFAIFLLLYYLYTRSRCLYVPIIVHISINFFKFLPYADAVLSSPIDTYLLYRWDFDSVLVAFLIINVLWLASRWEGKRCREGRSPAGPA